MNEKMKGINRIHIMVPAICCAILLSSRLTAQDIQWTQKQSLPNAYRNGGAIACNGKVYYMGGYCDSTPERFEKANYEYDPATNIWSKKTDIPAARSNFAMAAIDGKIYVIGGDPFSPKNEVYNSVTDSWDSLKIILTPRQHISCAVVEGKIYIAGGLKAIENGPTSPNKWSYANITNVNEVYDPLTNDWKSLASMPTKRHGAFMASVNGKIYVIGGMGDVNDMWKTLSTVEMYDPKTDKWEIKKSLPEPRDGFSLSVINDKIFVIGGFSGPETVPSVFVYDTKLDNWNTTTDFPNVENGSSACATIDNNIYIIGGCNKDYVANGNTFLGTIDE